MKKYNIIFLPLILLFIVGCAQAPISTSFEMTTQQKVQSVSHWNVIAEDVAEQIKLGLTVNNTMDRSVYLEKNANTPFNEGFQNMLLTKLLNKGVRTIEVKEPTALKISYNSQVVYHKAPLKEPRAGKIALLTGAVLVARELLWNSYGHDYLAWSNAQSLIAVAGGALTGMALLDDAGHGLFKQYAPNTEIIITTSVMNGNQYMFRKTDCYYINFADSWHYNDDTPSKTIKVVN